MLVFDLTVGSDLHHAQAGVVLAMSLTVAVFFASFDFEDKDLFGAELLDDFAGDASRLQGGRSDLEAAITADHQDVVKDDLLIFFARQFFDKEHVAFFDTVLLTAGLNDRIHGGNPFD